MTTKLDYQLDYEPLFEALLEKTAAGRLHWEETADEDTIVSSAKGERAFELTFRPNSRSALGGASGGFGGGGFGKLNDLLSDPSESITLRVKGADGRLLFETANRGSSTLRELYTLAKRITSRTDEQLDETLRVLQTL